MISREKHTNSGGEKRAYHNEVKSAMVDNSVNFLLVIFSRYIYVIKIYMIG